MTNAQQVTVRTAAGEMPAYFWLPSSAAGPRIVVFQEIFGVSDYVRSRCEDLADLGYAVLAPEFYWRLEGAEVDESREDFLQQAMGVAGRLDWDAAVADGLDAVAWLRARPETAARVGALGFCFGGGLAFAVAAGATSTGRADAAPDVLVSYYGSGLPQLLDLAPQVKCPSLHHFGLADNFIPQDAVKQIEATLTSQQQQDVTFRTYEGAGHAFDNPHEAFHHEDASREAWQATVAWLATHLPLPQA